MTGIFSIRQAFLHISHPLLRAYFEHARSPLDVDWERLDEKDVEPLLSAWRRLDDEKQLATEHDLQDVWFLGDERGVQALLSVAADLNSLFLPDVKHLESATDRALWVRIHREDVWSRAQGFLPIDQLTNKRLWRRFRDLKVRSIKFPETRTRALAEAVGGFFLDIDGQGQRHAADHSWKVLTKENYFAVYVDAGVEPNPAISDENIIQKSFKRRTVTIAFVYSPTAGTVRVYTERDARIARSLFERFHEVMFDEKAPPDDTRQTAYRLSRVLAEDFRLVAPDPSKVKSIAITQLRVRPKANMHRQIVLRGDTRNNGPKDTFDMIDTLLDSTRLPRYALEVDQMSVRVELPPGRTDNKRTLSFDVTWPNGGNLHNQPEALQPLGEAILEHWGIDTKPSEPADAWEDFLRLVDTGVTVIGRDTVDKWPNGLTQVLISEGILIQATPASAAICSWCHESHDATPEEKDGSVVYKTFCPELSRFVFIEDQRVQRFEILPVKLVPRVAQTFWARTPPTEVIAGCVWRLGMSTLSHLSRPLYFATAAGQEAVGSNGYPFESDAIVLVPHQTWSVPALSEHGVQFVRIQQALNYSTEGLIADIDAVLDDLSVPRTDRDGITKPWSFNGPAHLVAFGEEVTLPGLRQQEVKLLSIASGRWTVPLTLLFQSNGTAVWKEKLKRGTGSEAQRRKVSTAISRLNKSLGDAHAPLTFELPNGSEDLRIIA